MLSNAFNLHPASGSNPTSDSTSSASAPLPSSSTGSDAIQIMLERRLPLIVEDIVGTPDVGEVSDISEWISSLSEDGRWPSSEVDYTTGPAELHWQRIALMAAAWHGGVDGGDELVNSASLLDATSRAMDSWFKNGFTVAVCLGGKCHCSSSGFLELELVLEHDRYPKASRRKLPSHRCGEPQRIAGG
ncbi:hypothetical protein LXA43DRAFT_1088921 [Ganoderma leucocontextum]|nr:hypothetical protein LXA43DRAFT_1088921 [Ganoderma leucocontextum]